MATQDPHKEVNEKLIEILSNLLSKCDWTASLFLQSAEKKLQELLENAKFLLESSATQTIEPGKLHQDLLKRGYLKVYVGIYQSDPHNLTKWENTLKGIREYSVNRPIYRSEDYIQEAIRSKAGEVNEGYVAIYVKETDIIPSYAGKIIEDRWGHELLTLRDTALVSSNIVEFVHKGQRYTFNNGKLLLKSDTS